MEQNSFITEPLYPNVSSFAWEEQLFNTRYLRRLKHLAHFCAGSLITPVVHSRFEHTVGVWKLAAYYFPNDKLVRAAAILHDIGHLPFSHAVEKTLGYNHHQLTEKYINRGRSKSAGNSACESHRCVVSVLLTYVPCTLRCSSLPRLDLLAAVMSSFLEHTIIVLKLKAF
nr:HD domain-containing protein [Evansella caseinilytica]